MTNYNTKKENEGKYCTFWWLPRDSQIGASTMHLQVSQLGQLAPQSTRTFCNKEKEKGKKTSPSEGIGGWVQGLRGNLYVVSVSLSMLRARPLGFYPLKTWEIVALFTIVKSGNKPNAY